MGMDTVGVHRHADGGWLAHLSGIVTYAGGVLIEAQCVSLHLPLWASPKGAYLMRPEWPESHSRRIGAF